MTLLIADHLRRRARTAGSSPLLTYYDLGTGERTELSATSFLNWVDKTSNLLADEFLLEPAAVVDLELARAAPGHWVTLLLELAVWQVGATVSVGTHSGGPADLLVLGPDWQDHDLSSAAAVLACSLHPLGLGFADPLPAAVADFTLEVRTQPDIHSPAARSPEEIAWVDGQRRLTHEDLATLDVGSPAAPQARRLVQPTDPWSSVRDGLLVPLLTNGSSVLVVGDDPERLERLRVSERATD